jgi:hypothetical protein
MILTGMATDFNSGLLLILIALACWPHMQREQGEQPSRVRESAPTGHSARTTS